MPKTFHLKAGPSAIKHIQKYGFSPDMIQVIPAAAGGPKWIVLYALDKYLMTNWFNKPKQNLQLVGASAGAWRMMCYATSTPVKALDRFLKSYVEQTYPEWPTSDQVSQKMQEILQFSLSENGIRDILNPTNRFLNVITSETNFKIKEGSTHKLHFGKIVLKNLVSRKLLKNEITRVVFTNKIDKKDVFHLGNVLKTRFESLNEETILSALQATGAIPMLMDPVTDIASPNAVLWDGALVDYHIALRYHTPVSYTHLTLPTICSV